MALVFLSCQPSSEYSNAPLTIKGLILSYPLEMQIEHKTYRIKK